MIEKIISGGQTGADRGALEASKLLKIKTGGWAPRNYRTERCDDLSLKEFGLFETEATNYQVRTKMNVMESDGTVWFGNPNSPGGKLTLSTAKELNKPYLILEKSTKGLLVPWINQNKIKILNCAGNRESKNPGIQERVKNFLIEELKDIKNEPEKER